MKYIIYILISVIISVFNNSCDKNENTIPPPQILSEQLDSTKQIPILAWLGVPTEETNVTRFEELKNAGFTMNLSWYGSLASTLKALEIAEETDIKLIVSCPELATKTEETVNLLKGYSALAGYFLKDEPSKIFFSYVGEWGERILKYDNEHFVYANLYPTYASANELGTPDYNDYVNEFIETIPVEFISFDHYPILEGRNIRKDYYKNLEIISKAAKQAGKPFWAFALAWEHQSYRAPNLNELRFQVYSNLAYGAQGIQYFTYWRGLISDTTKERTPTYEIVKSMNSEIKALSAVFVGGEVIGGVYHTGSSIPDGTEKLSGLPNGVKKLETNGSAGAIVSQIKNGEYTYLVIVNRDIFNDMQVTIEFENKVKRIFKDTYINTVPLNSNVTVKPGDILIYRI